MPVVLKEQAVGITLGTARVRNPTPHTRSAFVRLVQPFAIGLVRAGTQVAVQGAVTGVTERCQLAQQGPAHTDGSIMYGRLIFPCDFLADELKTVTFVRQSGRQRDYVVHGNIDAVLRTGLFGVELQMENVTLNLAALTPTLEEDGPNVKTYVSRGRLPGTQFWAKLRIEIPHTLSHCRWSLIYGCCDPTNTLRRVQLTTPITLRIRGCRSQVRDATQKVMARVDSGEIDTTYTLTPAGVLEFGDAHAQALRGTFIFLYGPIVQGFGDAGFETEQAEFVDDVYALSMNWPDHSTWGTFGNVPARPPWMATDEIARQRTEEKAEMDYLRQPFNSAHPWVAPQYGCSPRPGATGDQYDFGTGRLWWLARGRDPLAMKPVLRSAIQEACRTIHFMETSLARVLHANHMTPRWIYWGGHTFYNDEGNRSPDMLGKVGGYPDWEHARSPQGEAWNGWDNEHWSHNTLNEAALMTGDPLLRETCDAAVECWMAMFQIDSGNGGNDNIMPARALGRGLTSGVGLWLATNRAEILGRALARVEGPIRRQWWGQYTTIVKAFTLDGPDIRTILVDQIRWWEQGIAVTGMWALYRATGHAETLSMLTAVARSLAFYAWQDRRTTDQVLDSFGNVWSGTKPVQGATITQAGSGATAKLAGSFTFGSWERVFLYDCVGQFTATGLLTATPGGQTYQPTIRRGGFMMGTMFENDGLPMLPEQFREIETNRPDPRQKNVVWYDETAFNTWSGIPTLLIGRYLATVTNDTPWLNRCNEILGELLARASPGDGGWEDGISHWTNVVANANVPWVGE